MTLDRKAGSLSLAIYSDIYSDVSHHLNPKQAGSLSLAVDDKQSVGRPPPAVCVCVRACSYVRVCVRARVVRVYVCVRARA